MGRRKFSVATRSDGTTYTHDFRSRLTQFAKGGTTATYLYDALGRRIRKTVNGTSTWFVWDGARLLAEFNGSGTRTQRYAYLGGDFAPTQVQDSNGTFYVHADRLDAPRLATNGSGVVVWLARYESFGKAVINSDPDGNGQLVTLNQRFPGQYADSESGSYYNYFRDYEPAIGRYVQSDPIGLVGGLNVYAYVLNRPTGDVDPLGLRGYARNFNMNQYNRRYPQRWNDPYTARPPQLPPREGLRDLDPYGKNREMHDAMGEAAEAFRDWLEDWADRDHEPLGLPPPSLPPAGDSACWADDIADAAARKKARNNCIGTPEQCDWKWVEERWRYVRD